MAPKKGRFQSHSQSQLRQVCPRALQRAELGPRAAGVGDSALFPPGWPLVSPPRPNSETHSRLSVEMPRAPAPESFVKKT